MSRVKDKMRQSETLQSVRVTPFEVELQEVCAARQGVSRSLAMRRALVRGSYQVVGAMGIAALRTKHGLTYAEMLEILGTASDGELPEPDPRKEDDGGIEASDVQRACAAEAVEVLSRPARRRTRSSPRTTSKSGSTGQQPLTNL